MKFLSYGRQTITKDDIRAVTNILRSDFLTQGPAIAEFEAKLCEYTGAKYAVVLNSGTAALHALYFGIGLHKGDEIIVPAMTFAATANAALYLGAKPIFVDVDPETGNMDPLQVESRISPKTKAIVPVHYAGQPVDLTALKKIAKKHNLILVDDACHALGAEYRGRKIGDGVLTKASALSFHPVKHITTGEGGAITTNDREVYERAQLFRTHGITKDPQKMKRQPDGEWYYEMQELGFNYRITDIQAALGTSQLSRQDQFIVRRRNIAAQYDAFWANNPYFDIPPTKKESAHAYHLYPIRLKDELVSRKQTLHGLLKKHAIGVQVHYVPVYMHPYYRENGYAKVSCPNAEEFYNRELSVPMFPSMTDGDVKRVARTLLLVCKRSL